VLETFLIPRTMIVVMNRCYAVVGHCFVHYAVNDRDCFMGALTQVVEGSLKERPPTARFSEH